jgi:hypothetical protein
MLILGIALTSCEEDAAVDQQPASIQFTSDALTLQEDDDLGVTVQLALSRSASSNAIIKLKIGDDAWQRLQTTPAHVVGVFDLPIAKGATTVQFQMKAIDNNIDEEDLTAEISLQPSSTFTLSERNTLEFTIQDDESPSPILSIANFREQVTSVSEKSIEGVQYEIQLSAPTALDSKVVISIAADNLAEFVTSPASENGKITLLVPAGATVASFTVNAINNAIVNGHSEVTFTIHSTEGSITRGEDLSRALTITDDELTGKLKGYEISGNDAAKKFFEYDVKGRISRINWETNTPNKRSGTETYFYDEQDHLIKINKYPGRDIEYVWTNGRIERSNVYQDNNLIQYAHYAYDAAGNIAGVEPYYKQSDGSFKRGLFGIFLYFTDGNIYKSLVYTDVEGQEEPVLVSTRTYEHYRAELAPLSMVEILPTVASQKNLAGSYTVAESGFEFHYTLTYESRPDGLPASRTATSSQDQQRVTYQYY